MKLNNNREWIERMSALDESCVSVGGLLSESDEQLTNGNNMEKNHFDMFSICIWILFGLASLMLIITLFLAVL